jgi:hypothetical protein
MTTALVLTMTRAGSSLALAGVVAPLAVGAA